MNEIVLVTSIAPKNLSNQRQAIASWIENGFHIVSCNSKNEIWQIQKDFPQVEFVEIHRDAQSTMGRPCPYIYDMLQILKKRIKTVGGIINSDIHLRNFNQHIYEYLYQEAQEKVIFMRRHDIDKIEDASFLRSTMFLGGIDVFLFHKDMIDVIPDDDMILGQIMWDYWLPIMWNMHQIKVKEFINPVTFHVRHSVQWDAGAADMIAQKLCNKYFPRISKEDATFYIKDKFWKLMSSTDLQICYVTDEMKRSKVIVQMDDSSDAIYNQTHSRITVLKKDELISSNYDFLFSIPYHIVACRIMVDLAIWILEQYEWDSMQLYVYWRGNISNNLKIENCNNQMLENFNNDITPIKVTRNTNDSSKKEGKMPLCHIYTSSIFIEEDKEKIWNAHLLKGRIYIYPAGYVAQTWVKRFGEKEVDILGFIDQSLTLQERMVCGFRVYSPSVLAKLETYDKVVIISNMYADEIYQTLVQKIPAEKILIWNEYDGKRWRANNEKTGSITSC